MQQLALPWPRRSCLHPKPQKRCPCCRQGTDTHKASPLQTERRVGAGNVSSSLLPTTTKCDTNRSEFAGAMWVLGVCFYTSCWSVVLASSRLIPAHPGSSRCWHGVKASPRSRHRADPNSSGKAGFSPQRSSAPRRLQPKESSLQDRNLPFQPGNLLWQSCRSQN